MQVKMVNSVKFKVRSFFKIYDYSLRVNNYLCVNNIYKVGFNRPDECNHWPTCDLPSPGKGREEGGRGKGKLSYAAYIYIHGCQGYGF